MSSDYVIRLFTQLDYHIRKFVRRTQQFGGLRVEWIDYFFSNKNLLGICRSPLKKRLKLAKRGMLKGQSHEKFWLPVLRIGFQLGILRGGLIVYCCIPGILCANPRSHGWNPVYLYEVLPQRMVSSVSDCSSPDSNTHWACSHRIPMVSCVPTVGKAMLRFVDDLLGQRLWARRSESSAAKSPPQPYHVWSTGYKVYVKENVSPKML
jgi:hypothetical protein